MGSGQFGCDSLNWLVRCEHELVQVVTQPARPAGRGRKTVDTAIAALAKRLQVPLCESADVNEPDFVSQIRRLGPDVILVIAFGQKIGPSLLETPNCRVVNLHGSLLPSYRGAAPINWAIINGETRTGITVIEINQQWDAGNILGQLATDINPDETAGELHDRMAAMGPELLASVLRQIAEGTDRPIRQDDTLKSSAPKLRKADGAIRWDQPAEQIHNQVHGMWPWPGAFCQLKQADKSAAERLTIGRARIVTSPGACTDEPGTLTSDLSIVCGSDRLLPIQLRPDGGKLMDFSSFTNGRRLQPGDRFLDG